MVLVEWPFLALVAATVAALRSSSLAAWRVEVLGVASFLLVAIVTASPGDAACLLVMAATGWAAVKLVVRHRSGLLLGLAIGCVLAEFLLFRQILLQFDLSRPGSPAWLAVPRIVGLSYVMFRVIHVIVDAHGGELPVRLRLRNYFCFLFCYLTFLAGPIQRIQDFSDDMQRPIETNLRDALATCAPAIVSGYFRFTVASALCFACFTWSITPHEGMPRVFALALGWLSFGAYLYVSFSGYSDIMRGIGLLSGLHLPENFDRPFAASNFLDLWSRWHISLSDWFKLYVFNPVAKEMISRSGAPALTPYVGVAGYFLTFFLMGLWHGIGTRFALYGLCLGAGVSVNKLYQTLMLRRLGRARFNRLTRSPAYMAAARTMALSFFVLALGFLWIPAVPADGGLMALFAGALIVTGCVLLLVVISAAAARCLARMPALRPGWSSALAVAQIVAVVSYLMLAAGMVPPLLYEYF